MSRPRVLPQAALENVPVFPLANVALFPGAMMPLHIFEGRYRHLVRAAIEGHRCIVMARLLDPTKQITDDAAFDPVGGLGVIAQAVELADGRFHVLLHGAARVRLEELPFVAPFRTARAVQVETVDDAEPGDLLAIESLARSFAAALARQDPTVRLELPARDDDDEAFIDALSAAFVMEPDLRQRLLAAEKLSERAALLLGALASHHADLEGARGVAAS